jgi:hypothetical protein
MLRKCILVALAACTSRVPQLPAALPDTCSSDSECGANFHCDHELRRCVCASDAACPGGKFCNAFTGLCVAAVGGCISNSACGPGRYCDTALRTCKAIPPGGQSNACIPDSLKLCAADADCADPLQTCDQTLKACIARNATCPAGDACDPQSRLCVHACASDGDCALIENGPGYQCRANACFRLALCAQDSDCTSGQICQANPDGSKSCHAGCVSNADCPLGSGCNTADQNHPRCSAGCTQSSDCALNMVCASGACVTGTASCTQACQATAVCPIGGTCIGNCCVPANFPIVCGSSPCSACTVGGGCPQVCSNNCFPLFLGGCSSIVDCNNRFGPVPGMVCSGSPSQCQVISHLSPCTDDSQCPMKGFRCITTSCGAGGVCFPSEQAAQAACAVGHP